MKYSDYERAFSSARLNKFLSACMGNETQAITLYKHNIILCQKFYGILNIFEVVLRNAINLHYQKYYNDNDWICNQLTAGGMLEHAPSRLEALRIIENLTQVGRYTNDRVVSSVSLGFWTYLFTKYPYKKGGNTLLKIFPNRQFGLGQRTIFNELQQIKNFRNRIAHQEAICFDEMGILNLNTIQDKYSLILRYIEFLGYPAEDLLAGIDILTDSTLVQIKQLTYIQDTSSPSGCSH